jgi:DeoR/GlpR family transcriptional regulator of sugar metabolism
MRIVTSSVDVAAAALDHQGSEVVLLGGTLKKSTRSAFGFAATDAIRAVRANIGIISNVCIDEDMHLRASDYDIAQLNSSIIEASKNVLVLVKAEELGSNAVHFIAALGAKARSLGWLVAP